MGIRIENLTKSFGEKLLFSDLSCSLPDKGLVKVIGASGKGKTTLLRIIAGLDNDYTGVVEGVGTVSYLFQEHRLFPWLNALDNIKVASFERPDPDSVRSAVAFLESLGLGEKDMGLKPSNLSGGMKQRVCIARAFLRSSDVLILDEPTKELDADLVNKVVRLIEEESKSRLVILATHDSVADEMESMFDIIIN